MTPPISPAGLFRASWRQRLPLLILLVLIPTIASANDVSLPGLDSVNGKTWNETAVRKVLHAFAYGAQSTDEQIRTWASQPPYRAIKQMLTFQPHNQRLSPPNGADRKREYKLDGSLRSLSDYWSSDKGSNRMPMDRRDRFSVAEWNGPRSTWLQATRSRGLNPFREKIGFFETNVHMAVNQSAGVSTWQLTRYYDGIMASLEAGEPYHRVIATAAKSAAIARQYGHNYNRFYNGECYCNEDFAREIHQLFFGILGVDDPDYHEQVTIKNTAAALTGMPIIAQEAPDDWAGAYVDFRTDGHHTEDLEILGVMISGPTASQKIDAITKVAIEHEESLENLPVMIISALADDKLTVNKKRKIRRAWRAMRKKDLLRFLRAYAISPLFHNTKRVKYHNSIDRHLIMANRASLNNDEHFRDLMQIWRLEWTENVRPFEPAHDVFGAQTGIEAADSSVVFRLNYNDMTESGYRFTNPTVNYDGLAPLERDWSRIAPQNGDGKFIVEQVASWLWNHLLADGGKNLGPLEKAHLHALLATGEDFGSFAFASDRDKLITSAKFGSETRLTKLSNRLGRRVIKLDARNAERRADINRRMGQAVNFILATPFAFAQEGR